MVVFPGATMDANGVDAVSTVTMRGLFDSCILETDVYKTQKLGERNNHRISNHAVF
jgi:hypothetical protein